MPPHPLTHTTVDKSHVLFDNASRDVVLTMPLEQHEDGSVGASLHIDGSYLNRVMGVPDADLLNLTKVEFTGANTNAGFAMGGHLHVGEPGSPDATPLVTASRVTHISGATQATHASHVVIPAGTTGVNTFISPPNGLGTVVLEPDSGQLEQTKTALGRELRWSEFTGKKASSLTGSCTEVRSGEHTRVLVPNAPSPDNCAMSKLLQANSLNPSFCAGAYHPDTRHEAKDSSNRDCTVMTHADFKSTESALAKNLTTQSKLQHGLSLRLKSFGPETIVPGQEVSVHATIHREKTVDTLAAEPLAGSFGTALTRAASHALLNESEDVSAALVGGPAHVMVSDVFAVDLHDGADRTGHLGGGEILPLGGPPGGNDSEGEVNAVHV